MARPVRLDHEGAVWHITTRGNEKRDVFRDDVDRHTFLEVLDRVVKLDRWRIHAYVLMTNHYHLLIETPEATLCKGMHRLNGIYSQRFNRRHDRVGHLFQGRYTSILVERETHLLTLVRYVVLNPVRAGMVRRAQDWKWSSYRATAGLARKPDWLDSDWVLAQFGTASEARRRYAAFVAAGRESDRSPWDGLVSQVFLGSDAFRFRAQRHLGPSHENVDVPRIQRRPWRPSLELLALTTCDEFAVSPRLLARWRETDARLAFAYLARWDAMASPTAFGGLLRVKRSAASRLAQLAESRLRSDARFRARVESIRSRISGSWNLEA